MPRVGGGDGGDLRAGRLPGGRVHQHLRHQRADRDRDRRPARARRLADGLGAGGLGRGRDRRAQPQEGGARARRLGSVHPPEHRRSRRDGRGGGGRAAREQRAGVQRRQAVRGDRRALRAVPREVHRGARGGEARGSELTGRHHRAALLRHRGRPARGAGSPRGRAGRDAGDRRRARRQLLLRHAPDRHRERQRRLPRGVLRPGGLGLPSRLRGRGGRAGQRHAVRPRLVRRSPPTPSRRCAWQTGSRPGWCS